MNQFYIYLHHGRTHPDQDLDGWGPNYPAAIGPFTGMHITYMDTVRFFYHDGRNPEDEFEAEIIEGLFFYDGMYYGDWGIITPERAEAYSSKVETPESAKFDHNTPEYVKQRAVRRLVPTTN